MEIYKLEQLYVTVCFVIASLCCCISFDFLKAIRNTYTVKGVAEAVLDIVFWIICSIIIYVSLYYSNGADIRWFEFLGAFIGIFVYIAFIRKNSYKIILKCVKIFSKIISFILKVLCIPCKMLHILIMPVKNIILKSKAAIYFVFHVGYYKLIYKTKNILTKIKRK